MKRKVYLFIVQTWREIGNFAFLREKVRNSAFCRILTAELLEAEAQEVEVGVEPY